MFPTKIFWEVSAVDAVKNIALIYLGLQLVLLISLLLNVNVYKFYHAEIFSTARKVDDGFKSLKKIIDSNSN